LKFFDDRLVAILLVLLFFATNYYALVIFSPAMSHGYLFFFFVLILWFTIQWHEKPSYFNSIVLGAVIGLACLARASEILTLAIPVFWKVYNWDSLKEKLLFVYRNLRYFILVIAVFVLFGIPQLI